MAHTEDRLSGPLQESVLTLLLFDNRWGATAAGLLRPEHFDLSYREIASRALDYRAEYHRPPGEAHIDDIFDHVLGNPKHKLFNSYRQILAGIIEQSSGLNAEYVASKVHTFVRQQTIKGALLEAGQRYQQGGEDLLPDVERILTGALKSQVEELDIGTYLGNRANVATVLSNTGPEFLLGIPELDERGLGLARKEMLLFTGVQGAGKSWFLIHVSRMALMQHAKIAYVTLEMKTRQVIERNFRNLFAIGKREEAFKKIKFERDELGKLIDFREIKGTTADRRLSDPKIKKFLDMKMERWGPRLNNVVIKSFPTGSLTLSQLEAWLDMLEMDGFIPDVLIIDYPDLMQLNHNNLRESLGRMYIDIRGLLDRRNLCGVVPTQANREGAKAKTVESTNVGEDWSKGMTTDMHITFSQTKQEKAMNLARLFVAKNRTDLDKYTVLISQNYAQGQFCVDSIIMDNNRYWDRLSEAAGEEDAE